MANWTDIEDFRRSARRRLPSFVFAYVEGGGYEEETLAKNRAALRELSLVPRCLNDVSRRVLSKELLGTSMALPLVLAPVGAAGFTSPNGEVSAAKAAQKHNLPFCLSTLSISRIEDVAAATSVPFWFQLYVTRDRSVTDGLIQRAFDAGCSTLILSLDLHVRSQRHREQKHGLVAPLLPTLPMAIDSLMHPRWLLSMLASRQHTFGNLVGLVDDAKNVPKLSVWLERQFDPTVGIDYLRELRKVWPRKLLVKGVMHPEDAANAIEAGADGVVVSNHGGRQVDGICATASIIRDVVDRVNGRGVVFVDSGIRSGMDLLKMLALGADGCFIGRPYVYGLACAGQGGVERVLEIFKDEFDETMGLCGLTDVNSLPNDLLLRELQRGEEAARRPRGVLL